ncbi:MAG: hypothetical protein QW100_00420 [Thermoplasmatales archaeon]
MARNEIIEEYVKRLSEAVQGNAQAIDEFRKETTIQGRPPVKVAVDLIRKYSGDLNKFFRAPLINTISSGYRGNILGVVSSIKCSEYEKEGIKKIRCIGSIEDRSGRLPFTEFPDGSSRLSRDDLVLIVNAYVGNFNNRPYLTISSRIELNIIERSAPSLRNESLKIKDLHPDMYDIKVSGKLTYIGKVDGVGKTQTTLFKGILRDETGSIPVESWGIELKDGDAEIAGASIKQFNNRLYLNIGNGTQIKFNSLEGAGEFKNLELLMGASRGTFKGKGIIIRISEKNLTVSVCATCQKVIKDGKCPNHPDSPVENILRLSLVLDDGYAAPFVYAYQRVLEKYVNGGKESIRQYIESNKVNELLPELKKLIVMKVANVSVYGFKGERGNYLEFQDLELLDDNALESQYNELLEALK